ncbi:MAG: hypothetical protein KDK28_18880 [Maritimibacter sp.]|nr:hypothetical protein [Maritimibacter sp.]
MIPLWRTDPEAAAGLGWRRIAGAAAIAWVAPWGLALVLRAAAVPVAGSSAELLLLDLGVLLVMVPLFSWAGLLPGAVVAAWLIRRGFGGLGPILISGFVVALLVGVVMGVGTGFAAAGLLLSGLAWGVLLILAPGRLRPPT